MKKGLLLALSLLLILFAVPVQAASTNSSKTMFTVSFNGNQIPQDIIKKIEQEGGTIVSKYEKVGALQFRGPSSLMKSLKGLKSVQVVSPSFMVHLPKTSVVKYNETATVNTQDADLYNLYQWDIKQVTNNGASYNMETGNHNVVVGIIDTGVSPNHPALKANFMGGRNYVPAGGFSGTETTETGAPTDYVDRNGHGSHVAGTIAGNGRIMGVAPNVGYRAYRVFGAEGGSPTSAIAAAMVDAVDDGVDVISMSLGGFDILGQYYWTDPETGETFKMGNDVADRAIYKRAVKYAVDNGVTVVVAAGNEELNATNKKEVTDFMNAEYGPEGYKFIGAGFELPGTVPGVITVSATGPDKSLASYSNYGAGFIDVTAPGGDYQSYPAPGYHLDMCLSAYTGTGYVWMAGTSMATPKVSAVAALIIAKYGNIGPVKVAQMIENTATDIGPKGKDIYFGKGMVNAFSALQ
ncbi:S8 family serine peptidase [Lederbergia wuyishanensis]|uniref:Subtilisin family serine protease n=1 Tax=Lederbergia wuyishanensis TaxID=1347903 RepID=A0ABU0D2C1_9BACI|nr:S8 family serine peptidase [Lederbergia wuyishanensis]MCJ8007296.1 S8 family serine peptidase [Lederbergia wuyishanensis]MDQ0342547.1 subtilisin family serine protease [Lederbergia wuyishanensis]